MSPPQQNVASDLPSPPLQLPAWTLGKDGTTLGNLTLLAMRRNGTPGFDFMHQVSAKYVPQEDGEGGVEQLSSSTCLGESMHILHQAALKNKRHCDAQVASFLKSCIF